MITNLFELAGMELEREVNSREIESYDMLDVLDRAVEIRRYLDIEERNKAISKAKKR